MSMGIPSRQKILGVLLLGVLGLAYFIRIVPTAYFKRLGIEDRQFTGDEPKYFRMLHSLAQYGRLDISRLVLTPEEKQEIQQAARVSGSRRWGDFYVVGVNGGIYCLHMPGLPFFLLPAYKLDALVFPGEPQKAAEGLPFLPLRLHFTRLWIMALAILSLLLLFRLLSRLFSSLMVVFFLLFLYIFNSPFPDFSLQFYPDFIGSFLCLLVLNAALFPFYQRWANDALLVFGFGTLPWLHQRLIPLSLGLFLCFIFYRTKSGISVRRIFCLSVLLALASLLYFYYFAHITGDPSPLSTSRAIGQVYARWSTLPLGFFANFFSREFGILWAYPWVILFFFGIYRGLKIYRRETLALLIAFIPYYLMCSAGIPWTASTLPAARFLLPLFPLILIFSGMALQDLSRNFSPQRLFFYLVYVLLVLLNKVFWHLPFNFGTSYVSRRDFILILTCLAVVSFFYLSLLAAEKFIFPRKALRQHSAP